jgi:hypothetical protein
VRPRSRICQRVSISYSSQVHDAGAGEKRYDEDWQNKGAAHHFKLVAGTQIPRFSFGREGTDLRSR